MRSGRGKCPQCKEIIVVDLDAQEIRCPLCHALLKKSSKSVEEVRAEEEARIAAAKAREQALAAEAEEEQVAAAADIAAEADVAVETPAEEVAPAEEAIPEEADIDIPTEEPAAEENAEEAPADEIGLTDEELAAMDDVPSDEITAEAPAEEEAVAEDIDVPSEEAAEAPAEEPVDEIGLTDDELAAMDDVPPTEEEVAATVEDAEEADIDIPTEEPAAEENAEEAPAEDAEEPAAEEAIPVEEAPAGEAVPADVPVAEETEEIPVEEEAEEVAAEEIPEEPAAEEPAAYVPTEEDMAFAASLSEGGRSKTPGKGFVATVAVNNGKPAKEDKKKKKERAEKAASDKGENKMNDNAIYKKPVAVLMMILSILTAAFFFLYYKTLTLGFISESLLLKVADILPTFGGEKFPLYVETIFAGLILVISILGLTGKRGTVAFIFVLLADLVYVAQNVILGFVNITFLADILSKFGEYVTYGMFGLLLLGAIFFAISLVKGSDDFEIHGGTAILPLIYLALVILGYAALVVLPKFISGFTVSAAIERYAIYGIWGLAFLLTLIGVHSATASRGANAWLLFSATMAFVLIFAASVVIQKLGASRSMESYPEIYYAISPVIALFPLAGLAAADLRN